MYKKNKIATIISNLQWNLLLRIDQSKKELEHKGMAVQKLENGLPLKKEEKEFKLIFLQNNFVKKKNYYL